MDILSEFDILEEPFDSQDFNDFISDFGLASNHLRDENPIQKFHDKKVNRSENESSFSRFDPYYANQIINYPPLLNDQLESEYNHKYNQDITKNNESHDYMINTSPNFSYQSQFSLPKSQKNTNISNGYLNNYEKDMLGEEIEIIEDNDEISDYGKINYEVGSNMFSSFPKLKKTTNFSPIQNSLIANKHKISSNLGTIYTETNNEIVAPNSKKNPQKTNLKSVEELPSQYRNIFSDFPYFNYVQSAVFDDVIYSNENMVISAPTSSGKTVILELAIVHLLITTNYNKRNNSDIKIVYMAPLKALCSEKYNEWKEKFEKLHNLKCIELTGDTDMANENDILYVENSNIICTTPEKWDVITRKWKNRRSALVNNIKLFLIDEIHVLGESTRGAIIEAVVSRMKSLTVTNGTSSMRFIAVSATIPNIEDFSLWLSSDLSHLKPAITYKLDETYRPVELKRIVLGYYCSPKMSDYSFDLTLNYKIAAVINEYSNSKPTLIFCSTRKGTAQSAFILAKTSSYIRNQEHKNYLYEYGSKIKDLKLQELVLQAGIGYHHAGLDSSDRQLIEGLFLKGLLLVLFSTSTLSIGVNLPAHLVIVKSTMFYSSNQVFVDYSTSQILQMIGRAGRPQFDKSATAVIMTKQSDKIKYETLFEGSQLIESHLHENLIEHLNVEIVLGTVTNISSAITWLKSTYLYARLSKNPSYYGISSAMLSKTNKNDSKIIDNYLTDICMKNIKDLMNYGLIRPVDLTGNHTRSELRPTINGGLMARFCVAFETMKSIITNLNYFNIKKPEESLVDLDMDVNQHENLTEFTADSNLTNSSKSLQDLICLISESKEFEDIKLRINEKSILNTLNNNGKIPKADNKNKITKDNPNIIRFISNGKVKSTPMKISVLLQAQFGCIQINDFSLNQDLFRIMRVGHRIAKCLLEYLLQNDLANSMYSNNTTNYKNYDTFINAVILYKCFTTKLWHDSRHIFKQFTRIGTTLSHNLVNANICTFDEILSKNPRYLESVLNKNPPFGELLQQTVRSLPKFKIDFKVVGYGLRERDSKKACVDVICSMINYDYIASIDKNNRFGMFNQIMFICGDELNNLLCVQRLNNTAFLNGNGQWTKRLNLNSNINGICIHASLICMQIVGLDVHESFDVFPDAETNEDANTSSNQEAVTYTTEINSKLKAKKKINLKRLSSSSEDSLNKFDTEIYNFEKTISLTTKRKSLRKTSKSPKKVKFGEPDDEVIEVKSASYDNIIGNELEKNFKQNQNITSIKEKDSSSLKIKFKLNSLSNTNREQTNQVKSSIDIRLRSSNSSIESSKKIEDYFTPKKIQDQNTLNSIENSSKSLNSDSKNTAETSINNHSKIDQQIMSNGIYLNNFNLGEENLYNEFNDIDASIRRFNSTYRQAPRSLNGFYFQKIFQQNNNNNYNQSL